MSLTVVIRMGIHPSEAWAALMSLQPLSHALSPAVQLPLLACDLLGDRVAEKATEMIQFGDRNDSTYAQILSEPLTLRREFLEVRRDPSCRDLHYCRGFDTSC